MYKNYVFTLLVILLFSFSSFSQNTAIPDNNFENYLETHDASGAAVLLNDPTSMGNGIANDNLVFTNRINTVTTLNIFSQNIADLTGVEDFTALQTLSCQGNILNTLDITNNTALTNLNCNDNNLNTLNIGNNPMLTILRSNNNNLNVLDLSNITSLTLLQCGDNNLSALNVSNNPALTRIDFQNNNLTTLNLSSNIALTELFCFGNNLNALDLSTNTALTVLNCSNNNLSNLDLSQNLALVNLWVQSTPSLTNLKLSNGNNSNISILRIDGNPNLTCVTLDTQTIADNWNSGTNLPSTFSKDPIASFSEDCVITIVPDTNFEFYLETHDASGAAVLLNDPTSMGNGIANDNLVFTNRINTVTTLNVINQSIADLTGIERFAMLTSLNCFNNQLTNIDVSNNTALTSLALSSNQLTSLDVSNNTALTSLALSSNQLTSLDVSNNTVLTFLDCSANQLNFLDVANTNNINFTYYDSQSNLNLGCIKVDDVNYSNLNWTNIDFPSVFSTNCGTYVPDDNFENYLETHNAAGAVVPVGPTSMGNGIANDNFVFTNRINTVTALYVLNQSIADLTGIEDFIALTILNCNFNQITSLDVLDNTNLGVLECDFNQLTSIDVSNNTSLNYLSCGNNQITNIDVSANTALEDFKCHNNQLTSLDISQNTALTILVCSNNQITNLDVSANTGLQDLRCEENQLTSLDVSNNAGLTTLWCLNNQLTNLDVSQNTALTNLDCANNLLTYLNVANGNNLNTILVSLNNPNLTCIKVDDENSMFASSETDPTSSFSEDCDITVVSDANFEDYLETHDINGNVVVIGAANSMGDGISDNNFVTASKISGVTNLDINSQNIADLTGIEDFAALSELYCFNNQLTSLDVSANTGLTILNCGTNQLTSIDVSNNTSLNDLLCNNNLLNSLDVSTNAGLTSLFCGGNQLAKLDVSSNAVLNELECYNNQLVFLDVANGNNANFVGFNSQNNPNLSCIKVDDINYSDANWTKDPTSTFNTDCGTFVPDDNFENYLESHNAAGAVVNLGNPTSMGNGIANDNYATTANISGVSTLNIQGQGIADLTGIEGFTGLNNLNCSSNQLNSINLSANTALTVLNCSFNQLTGLDVSGNTGLSTLNCFNNQLSSLDVSTNTVLTYLGCYNNQLTSLELVTNTALTFLSCLNNQLTTLDVTANTALTTLVLLGNQLTYLNVANGNNTNLISFNSAVNPNLSCIQVDNVAYSLANWTNIDPASSFSEACSITFVPDTNFENYLETHNAAGAVVTIGAFDSMGNGIANDHFVTTNKINTVSSLNISGLNIADLRGIGGFIGLTSLNCGSNVLSSLDVSKNLMLNSLDCFSNELTSLNVSQNTNLTFLSCGSNQLASLDVSLNIGLSDLECGGNQLTSLDVSNNTALTFLDCFNNQLQYINAANGNNINLQFASANNPDLICIKVDNVAYSIANWTNIDPASSFSTNCGTYVPDDNFELYLETHDASGALVGLASPTSMGNGFPNDNFVTTTKISGVPALAVGGLNISDLSGIEDFASLATLDCFNNQLTGIDISANTVLTTLNCNDNQLTSLDVSLNTALTTLNCYRNQLTNLDVSNNIGLTYLDFDSNQLRIIDVSANTMLNTLFCQSNQLSFLNISANLALTQLYCNNNNLPFLNLSANTLLNTLSCQSNLLSELDVSNNTALEYLLCTNNQLTSLDVVANTALTDLYCRSNQLTSLDVSQNTALTILDCGSNQLTNIDISLNTALTQFSCRVNQLTSLDVSTNTALEWLSCRGNQLTSLDLSTNTALINLYCYTNQLTSLDVSTNTNLADLWCFNNQITSLDVSANTALTTFYCNFNQLTYLDVANGNNVNLSIFSSQGNPDLSCIKVDNVAYSDANWAKDSWSTFSTGCGTYVPDDNFETYLETHDAAGAVVLQGDPTSMGDGNLDNYVPTNKISGVTSLNVNNQNIADLTGIKDFLALSELFCRENQLTNLDVSANTNLIHLDCFNNQLTSLDVSTNIALEYLSCIDNQLTSLDVTANTALTNLYCRSNQLTSLDVSQNTALNILDCGSNQLPNIDVSLNTVLTQFSCRVNQLTSLDVSTNTALEWLSCRGNQLTSLDLSTNTALINLYCFANQLTSLDVSTNTNLAHLECFNNQITSLDVSNNTMITYLDCFNNQLEFLDVSNGNNTNITLFNSITNPALFCITVDDPAYSTTNWTARDPASAFSTDCGTYVPDNNFENYLETHDANGNLVTIGAANSMGDGIPNNNFVTTTKISGVTTLTVNNLNIADLTGIEDFAALTMLNCPSNQLTSINLSNNTDLEILECYNNQLTSLDVSDNTALVFLDCMTNSLIYLNVANGNNTNFFQPFGFNSQDNPNLTCIQVDDAAYSVSNWSDIDPTSSFSIDCSFNDLPVSAYPLSVGANFEEHIQIGDNTNATRSESTDPTIPSLLGECGLYNGDDLWYSVSIPDDGSIIVETKTDDDSILNTGLALYSGAPGSLVEIDCNDDSGSGDSFSKMTLTGQTPGATIYVRVWSWANIETGTFKISAYRDPATSTYVPDDNFENYLETHNAAGAVVTPGPESMGNGIENDNFVTTANISGVITLNIQGQSIVDLTGIEEFTGLNNLNCSFNKLTSLDMSANTALNQLDCRTNKLTNLDISHNTNLFALICVSNQLTSLDVSANTNLLLLACSFNELSNLNVTANTGLNFLICNNNQFSSLDVSANTGLVQLECYNNQLTSLNIANGNNSNISNLRIENNTNLTCVTVDNQTLADNWNSGLNLPLNYLKAPQTQFSANCDEVVVEAKAFLQGAFLNPRVGEEAFMRDDLRTNSLLPTISPYTDGISLIGNPFTTSGQDAIVDWVWVELRDNTDNTLVIDGQSALLQRDGDIVAPDGVNPLVFAHPAKYYKVVVKHRNHLGIMTGSSAAFPKDRAIDFKTGAMSSHGTNGEVNISGTFALWAGNVNNDGIIQYAGTSPDTSSILSEVLNAPGNFLNFATYVIDGYNTNDINMDGKTQYTGTNPDSPFVLQNVLTHPGNFLNFSTHQILEQLPEN